jgi:CDP-glucose 4,6-dehydratase
VAGRPRALEDLGVIGAEQSEFWRDRPTLVTGATGLVGSWLVKHLVAMDADVVCLVRDWVPQSELVGSKVIAQVKTVRGDVRDQRLLERILGEYEIDTVFHLAAQTIVPIANRNPVSTFESNVAGTWSLLEACRRSPSIKQIVLASSDKSYGEQEQLPYVETMPLAGRHPYDVSKSAGDLIAQSYAATYGLPVVITRCGNFYGGGDLNWSRIVPGTIRSVLRRRRPVIRSDGQFVRDYFYVEDGAAAYAFLAERMAADSAVVGEAFNFSYERPISVLDLTTLLLGLLHSDLEPDIRNQATNEIRCQYLSAAKARERLGWQPVFQLEDGLSRTIEWYRNFFSSSPS